MHSDSVSSNQQSNNPQSHRYEKCRHCSQLLTTYAEQRTGFCCSGCHAAYDLIQGLGLDYFYTLRTQVHAAPTHFSEASRSRFSHFDDEKFAALYIALRSQSTAHMVFHLSGIHCSACIWLLEKLPQVLYGLIDVRVDLVRGRASVLFNPSLIRPSEIGRAFNTLGYAPHPIARDALSTQQSSTDHIFLAQLGVAAFSSMNVMLLFFGRHEGYLSGIESSYAHLIAWVSLLLSLPVVTFSALPFYRTSWSSLRLGKLHIDLPIALAIVGGFCASAVNTVLGRPEIYFDTVTTLVFLLLLGRWFQRRALKRVAHRTDLLYSLSPLAASRVKSDGTHEEVFIESLVRGDRVQVESGELFPCDGTVLSDTGYVSNAILTGESEDIKISRGDIVFAGTRNTGNSIAISVTHVGVQTRIGQLVEEARSAPRRESATARFVDRASVYFVVGVLTLAILTFLLWFSSGAWTAWDHVIALLVVSCPCALGIATPVTLSLAGARAAQRGILIKDGEALERLARVTHVIFDKTGTLTTGELGVFDAKIHADRDTGTTLQWPQIWQIIHGLESGLSHPIAKALVRYAPECGSCSVQERQVLPGKGIIGTSSSGSTLSLGSMHWLTSQHAIIPQELMSFSSLHEQQGNSVIGLAIDSQVVAACALADSIRPEARAVVHALMQSNITVGVLSGDSQEVTGRVALHLGIPAELTRGELSPEEKAAFIRALPESTVFVGDGANDSLALSQAGVGIGIQGGAEISLGVSDLYLLHPNLQLIVDAIHGARTTLRQVHRHLGISLFYNIIAASLAVAGQIGPLAAALVMPLSSLTVITSSLWSAPFKRRLP